ncbi:hypothetical protein FE414_07210 [Leuconostoc carnosum]|uniref:hypothetical protein n=1 Tax=Leuconostoc carnosum TaxID=1252 RepID=UPI001239D053|nr:hypothetical protein [Leuconostoc carnosum]KAA8369818.1 hypothetical protein FE414_07210 [Leuconostoc carnosum]
MADKKVYAWAYGDDAHEKIRVSNIEPDIAWNIEEPLYSIEEVQHVIENNELPKRPVAWVYWDNNGDHKRAVLNELHFQFDNVTPVYSADELLAELQKEI